MSRMCTTTCCRCGDKFDRLSGKLVNISDRTLEQFYQIPFIQEYLKTEGHKHPTLCADCLVELLGHSLGFADFKYKNNHWMTSNVAYVITHRNIPQEKKQELLTKLQAMDKSGVIDIKLTYEGNKQFIKEFLS